MHLFFDTVWKLHIGEIPEKPRLQPHYLGTKYGGHRFKILTDEYNAAIAAIKQNALTVGNPEILNFEHGEEYDTVIINGDEINKGEFYKWVGGYEKKKIQVVENWGYQSSTVTSTSALKIITVAILTLPEEKKNTMENNDKIFIDGDFNDSYEARIQRSKGKKKNKSEPPPTTAIGSVAAPKPKTEGRWFKDWKKITEAVIPKGPMCRDCADEDGTCPNNDGLPCDPTDEVIERFKRLRQQLEGMKSILKEIEFQVYAEGWSPQERLAEIKKKFPKR